MKHKMKCPDCDWTRSYNDKAKGEQGLRMHRRRKHGKVKSYGGGRQSKKEKGEDPLVVNFCPECGCPIRIHNRAALMARRMT